MRDEAQQARWDGQPDHAGQTGRACVAGKYKDVAGSAKCLACPSSEATSAAGSDDVTDCTCNAGYTGPDGGECTA